MSNWIGTTIYLIGFVISIVIRIPYDKASKETKTKDCRKGSLERFLLSFMALGCLILPILSLTPLLSFAQYNLQSWAVVVGSAFMLLYLWLFRRSHSDLGRNWSVTLEIREEHSIVDHGVYRSIRHPMYAAIYLMAIGQAFLVANWLAGPSSLITFSLMFFCRLSSEEKMMLDQFGAAYESYRLRTKRLMPGVW